MKLNPRIGLGCWRIAGPGRPPLDQAVSVIQKAYEAGARVFDTADSYSFDISDEGYGEEILAAALGSDTPATIITKGGWRRPGGVWTHRADPAWLEQAIGASLTRLKRPQIDCYLLHGVDPAVPIEASLEPIVKAKESGLITSIGISNVTAHEIERAQRIAKIEVVQNRLSLTARPSGWREAMEATFRIGAHYIPHTPFGPTPEEGTNGAYRSVWDVPEVLAIADHHGVSEAQIALAWLLQLDERVVVTPGARRTASILDSLKATDVSLGVDEVAVLDALVSGGGARS